MTTHELAILLLERPEATAYVCDAEEGSTIFAGKYMTPPKIPDNTKRPVCWLCKKPIKKTVHHQGGNLAFPSHKKCLVEIKRAKDGGI